MKPIALLFASAASFVFFTSSSCEKKQQTADCPPGTICTMMFASIGAKVTDSENTAVDLNEVYTLRKGNGEILNYKQNGENGYYVIVDDSYQKKLQNQTDTFQFVGKKDGKTVVDEIFVISSDCCHVNKLTGKSEIIIP